MRVYLQLLVALICFSIFIGSPTPSFASDTPGARGNIESPTPNTEIPQGGTLDVSGWAIDPSGVKSILILLDGTNIGIAKYGLKRTDVGRAFPSVPDSINSGFTFTFTMPSEPLGAHSVSVEVLSEDGQRHKIGRVSIDITTGTKTYGQVDTPRTGANIRLKGSITTTGWVIDPSGVKQIFVYIDSHRAGQATYGLARPNVYQTHTHLAGDTIHCGFSFQVNTSSLGYGSHDLKIIEVSQNGQQHIIGTRVLRKAYTPWPPVIMVLVFVGIFVFRRFKRRS